MGRNDKGEEAFTRAIFTQFVIPSPRKGARNPRDVANAVLLPGSWGSASAAGREGHVLRIPRLPIQGYSLACGLGGRNDKGEEDLKRASLTHCDLPRDAANAMLPPGSRGSASAASREGRVLRIPRRPIQGCSLACGLGRRNDKVGRVLERQRPPRVSFRPFRDPVKLDERCCAKPGFAGRGILMMLRRQSFNRVQEVSRPPRAEKVSLVADG